MHYGATFLFLQTTLSHWQLFVLIYNKYFLIPQYFQGDLGMQLKEN